MAARKPENRVKSPNSAAKKLAKPVVDSDEHTIELTRKEIESFGADGKDAVRAGGRHIKPRRDR